jgi:diguanylate cyclase (GGDEF)-like protein
MSSLAPRPTWKFATIIAVVLGTLVGGTWAIQTFTIQRLLYQDAVSTGHDWASHLAQNVRDIADIARGERPSPATMTFFETAKGSGGVFRYKIFAPDGRLRFVVPDDLSTSGSDKQNLGEHNTAAAAAIAAGQPLVVAKEGKPPSRPPFFSEAYVPVVVDGKVVAIAEAYVDQTDKRDHFRSALMFAAGALSLLVTLAFGIPAVAWVKRSTEKLRAEERIRFLARHDALTGLPNRDGAIEVLGASLSEIAHSGKMVAVHYVGLDKIKGISDTLGHEVGDRLITLAAQRLRSVAGPFGVIARLAADEFLLIQHNVVERAGAERMANGVIAAMAAPFTFDDHRIDTMASVGVSISPVDGDDAIQLIRYAVLAMHSSCACGPGRVAFFAPDMDNEFRARLELEQVIRDAVAKERFDLFYQPIVDCGTGRLLGFEALLRLPLAGGRLVSPGVFIPIAEQIGLISTIGAWVIRQACRTAAAWPEHLSIAVNVSAAEFANGSVCETVAAALAETKLDASRLEIEITESLLLEQTGAVLADLAKLKAMGVAIVMDDFGTGYSSLGYLWRFPFDKIKVDRSFMLGFDAAESHTRTVVETIVSLARSLNMRVAVEGIETERQLDFVRGVNCDQLQGFHFGRPMPSADVAACILKDFQAAHATATEPQQASADLRLAI